MKCKVGLWIDHRRALIVTVTDQGVETRLTISRAERQLRRCGSSPLKGSFDDFEVPHEGTRKRAFVNHLNAFYDAVIAGLANAEDVLILGPGEAKNELRKRMARSHLDRRIAAVQTLDKLTDRQVAAHVQKYFAA
jgi:hypothetical protein